MKWPTALDYQEAIQNPRLCFSDPELRDGVVDCSGVGLPRLWSGNFAAVYRIRCNSRRWAVKCFTRHIGDQQKRYALISEHLKRSNLPCMVGFHYIPQGIRVGGQWFPVLRMEWVEGEALDSYLRRNLAQPKALGDLARRWVDLMTMLRTSQIAHGDLQHGNILLANGTLKLIDYDGMYVPALKGQPSKEYGLPGFQHPRRSDRDYGPDLDNFSAWVILVSILALSAAPELWDRLNRNDDQKLLVGREDLVNPYTSDALSQMRQSGNQLVADLVLMLSSLLTKAPGQVPPLDASQVPFLFNQPPPQSPGDDWINDHKRPSSTQSSTPAKAGVSDATGWWQDHIEPTVIQQPRFDPWPEQIVLVSGVSAAGAIFAVGSTICNAVTGCIAALAVCLAALLFPFFRYRRLPFYREKVEIQRKLRTKARERRTLESEMKAGSLKQNPIDEAEKRGLAECDRALQQARKRSDDERNKADNELRAALQRLDQRSRELMQDRSRRIAAAEKRAGAAIDPLQRRVTQLDTNERAELDRALRESQDQFLNQRLWAFSIRQASIPGIGPVLTDQLRNAGITTAADVERRRLYRISNFGPVRVDAIVDWRKECEQKVRSQVPSSLPADVERQIRQKYGAERSQLMSQVSGWQMRLESERQQIESAYQSSLAGISREQENARRTQNARIQGAQQVHSADQSQISSKRQAHSRRAEAARTRLREELDGLTAQLVACQTEMRRLEREALRFRGVSLRAYVLNILNV